MKKIFGFMLVAMLIAAAPAAAADVKIGVIDLQKVLRTSLAGQAAQKNIAEKAKAFQETMQGRQKDLQKLNADFEKQKMVLSKEAVADKERDLQQKVKDFQRFGKDAQEELQQEDRQATTRILDEVAKVVKEMGAKAGYDVIVEKSTTLYTADRADLTDQVVKAYDKQFKGK
ncbi:OmpH-like outer membrane protein, putative [Syntrophotalea carbinolica DSM 2380]|uniref:OmpH-like outer membrane protein, putative n=1 Tax=Syntrophotalea carbinolica (strain DSM 2380 / NBRC 103641 / GraBd1) TaxID=338963 RepID=Q3A556_SYNC1|nr:OmpH family outer membrane protein [Syntrophotalea carbinolica]ABA88501.1 OmpH-like outer membrane protein, putative [Syntrophotalea carbinolica DSM 2380]